MKNLISVLTFIAILIVVSSNLAISEDKKFTLTQKQIEFAEEISSEQGFSKAEWVNSYVFDVTIDQDYFGSINTTKAETYAVLLGIRGFAQTKKTICVKILDTVRGEIGYHCVGKQSET